MDLQLIGDHPVSTIEICPRSQRAEISTEIRCEFSGLFMASAHNPLPLERSTPFPGQDPENYCGRLAGGLARKRLDTDSFCGESTQNVAKSVRTISEPSSQIFRGFSWFTFPSAGRQPSGSTPLGPDPAMLHPTLSLCLEIYSQFTLYLP